MPRKFNEKPDKTQWQRLLRWARQGRLSLWAGGVLIVLLILGNVVAFSAAPQLMREDRAFRQPPQWALLQRLLYRAPARVEPVRAGSRSLDGLDELLGGLRVNGAARENAEGEAPHISSRPHFTATVGRAYRYSVDTQLPSSDVRFETTGPLGMSVTTNGVVEWIPAPEQVGPITVVVRALDGTGAGTQQAYQVIVSERYHPFGTDEFGRDLVAALILGTRWTILPGCIAVVVSLMFGVLFGGLAGYHEGRTDAFLGYVTGLSEAFPALLLLFLAAVIFQYRLEPIMVVLGLVLMPAVARDVRARVQALKARQFVEASRELGLPDARILWIDIVWYNARDLMLGRAFYAFGLAVVIEVTLSYLRIGVQPPTVSWGNMIFSGRDLLNSFGYWLIFFPSLATVLAVSGYALLGSGLAQLLRIRKT